jgi:predicted RNase H-like HicB family nuclease
MGRRHVTMKFKIIIERDEDGRYVAECPDLPGCLSEGETLEEAIENINEAIIGCMKSRLKTAGEKLKIPSFDRRLDISIDLTGNSHAQASTG